MNLEGAYAKLERARFHLETLREDVEETLAREQVSIVAQPGHQPHELLLFAGRTPSLPTTEWALIAGDCVHNARVALDYAVWEASGARRDDTRTQFPIFTSEEAYHDSRARRRIRDLPPALLDFVYRLQPFGRGPSDHALAALDRLDGADKHQLLQVVRAQQGRLSGEFGGPNGEVPSGVLFGGRPTARIVAGELLAAMRFEGLSSHESVVTVSNVAVNLKLAFDESVGLGPRVLVLEALDAVIQTAEHVVNEFAEWQRRERQ
jgi:hypothetical protein